MPGTTLTQKKAEKAAPTGRRYFLNDHEVKGLRLAVFPSGEKSWQVRYRVGRGRNAPERVGTIGAQALFTLDEAREKARPVIKAGREGKDIMIETLRSADLTVEVLWTEFFREHARKLAPTARECYAREAACFTSDFGRTPVAAVSRGLVVRWKEKNERRPVFWNKAFKRLKQAWKWGQDTRKIAPTQENPFVRIESFPENETAGTAYTLEEIQRIGHALEAADIDAAYVDGFRLMALTSCRPGEIFSLRKDQIDLDVDVIRLQRNAKSAKTKTRRQRNLPITGPMRALLVQRLAELEDSTPWLFPNQRGGYLRDWDIAWRKVREISGVEGRAYDLRHTVGTTLAEAGANQAIIMSIMGHRQLSTSQKYMHARIDPTRTALEEISTGIASALLPGGIN